ncbi:MAG: flagellar FlbD family protein [Firmicutes bacterium]|nr:flagellar FlbD family protein [Bacillota bacterium]
MIKVKKLNQEEIVVNADLIEYIEANPDVVITLTTGNKIVVRETMEEVVKKVIEYKSAINLLLLRTLQDIQGVKGGQS